MENFLKSSKDFLKNQFSGSHIVHLVMGNESSDLDSTIAALTLAYFLYKQQPENTRKYVIPIMNVNKEDFLLRTEVCYVLQQAKVPLEQLIYRNDLNFEEITSKHTVEVTLVDHHILNKSDEILSVFVREIIDHRPLDNSHHWDCNKVQIRIEQVGSCCTLIADKILNSNSPDILCKSLAYLLYQTIIYDTIALKVENHKATPLDIKIGTTLEQLFQFTEDRQMLFDKLWQAHNNVSNLTPRQLLNKDLKLIGGVYIPGLPMLVEEYLQLSGSLEAIEAFVIEHNVTCTVLIGLNASDGKVQRDLGIYSKTVTDKLRHILLEAFKKANIDLNGRFEERRTKYGDKIHLLHMHNIKLSRKQLVPVVKDAWKIYSEEI